VADLRPGRPSREPARDTPAGPARTGSPTGISDGDGAVPETKPLTPADPEQATPDRDDDQALILSWRRLLVCLLGGLAVAVAVGVAGLPGLSVLAGWSVTSAGVLFWVWWVSWPQDAPGTKRAAEEEGDHSWATDTVVLVGAVAGLVAVVEALIRSNSRDTVAVVTVLLSLLTVVLSWALVNTVFALKYARLYYAGGDGGIDFHQERPPTYSDFAYLAFTVGMSFAVSDTDVGDPDVRKVALGHALLSFLFGTFVIAVAINVVTNLGQS
jgi:uncharacterized membrane protein